MPTLSRRLASPGLTVSLACFALATPASAQDAGPKPAEPKAQAAAQPKSTLEVAGKVSTAPADPVVDQYRRKLSMALF